jgi:hypothetical protein
MCHCARTGCCLEIFRDRYEIERYDRISLIDEGLIDAEKLQL